MTRILGTDSGMVSEAISGAVSGAVSEPASAPVSAQVSAPVITPTGDGSQTLRSAGFGESYHSMHGAVTESMHVFIRNGLKQCAKPRVNILEIGFGTGLNALLTLREAELSGQTVEYAALELYPVDSATAAALDYASDPLFMPLHETPWDHPTVITQGFTLLKLKLDLVTADLGVIFDKNAFDIVYFDAFSPQVQPELWTAELFGRIFEAMSPDGALVTYCAKGDVKRALRSAGFEVSRLEGPPGKRHMLRARKH